MRQELFDQAIGDVPVSTVDLERIVARQDRLLVMRRSGIALAAVLTVAVTVAGVGLLRPTGAAEPGASVGVTTAPTETAEQKAARVQAAWLRAAQTVLPGAQWRVGHDGSLETPSRADYFDATASPVPPSMFTRTNDGDPGEMSSWRTGDRVYHTFGLVTFGGVESSFHFRTEARDLRGDSTCSVVDGVFTCGDDFFCRPGDACTRSSGPKGEAVLTVRAEERFEEYGIAFRSLQIWVRSADGRSTVEAVVTNRAGTDRGPAPVTTDLAVTEAQLLRLLLEPGLMI